MSKIPIIAAALALGATTAAQESYWIGNRTSSDVMQVDQSGRVLQTVAMGTNLRSAHVAPDGKVWVVRFIQSQVDILNPDGTPFATIPCALGSAYDIAFDAAGHAWISGGTGVEEFDAAGNSVQQYPLSAAAPLGITVDADGNKWIAHRIGPPGSVSRIDATTGAITNHTLASGSLILPTKVTADRRGIGNPSHIWVVGDNRGAGELVELDAMGNVLATNVLSSGGNLGSLVCDVDPATLMVQNVWVGDFRNGDIWQFDVAAGTAVAHSFAPDTIGLAIDGFQNLWQTARGTTVVRRIDRASPAIELETTVGAGVQSSLATGWHHATVVDPLGDLDGDTAPNWIEIQQGSSPFDPCSIPGASITIEGSSQLNSLTAIEVLAAGRTALAFGTLKAGTPITVPGVACQFELDPFGVFPFSATVVGSGSIGLLIPNNAALVGADLFVQGLNLAVGAAFTNVSGWRFQ